MTPTTNLGLPIYGSNDVPKWDDTNQPFQTLDEQAMLKNKANTLTEPLTVQNTFISCKATNINADDTSIEYEYGETAITISDRIGSVFTIQPMQKTAGEIDLFINKNSVRNPNGKVFINNAVLPKLSYIDVSGTYDASGNIFIETGHNTDHQYLNVVNLGGTGIYDTAPVVLCSANGSSYLHGISNSTPPASVSDQKVNARVYYLDFSV